MRPKITVITNKYTHQRGSGLFISRRSSSHTWPVVLSSALLTVVVPLIHSKTKHAKILMRVRPATYRCQKSLVKSLMMILLFE